MLWNIFFLFYFADTLLDTLGLKYTNMSRWNIRVSSCNRVSSVIFLTALENCCFLWAAMPFSYPVLYKLAHHCPENLGFRTLVTDATKKIIGSFITVTYFFYYYYFRNNGKFNRRRASLGIQSDFDYWQCLSVCIFPGVGDIHPKSRSHHKWHPVGSLWTGSNPRNFHHCHIFPLTLTAHCRIFI